MEPTSRLKYLLDRMQAQTASDAELQELQALVAADESGALLDAVEQYLPEPGMLPAYDAGKWTRVADQILAADRLKDAAIVPLRRKVPVLHRAGWAAAIIVLVAVGGWWLHHAQRPVRSREPLTGQLADVGPASNGAILTLANGQQVSLDSMGNGVVARQQGTRVVLQGNTLQYEAGSGKANDASWNTVSTPYGRQFQLVLPDGSKVWMNAGSTLQFPVAFTGDIRQVKLSGEAYFDIRQNSAQPFHVQVNNNEDLTVLGTAFNVNAYTNEQRSFTTLISGALRVSSGNASVTLKPGQQAVAAGKGVLQLQAQADTETALAWKNGLFNFNGVGLHAMLRQLERWYDLQVVYEGNVPDVQFFGEMSRNLQLSDVLAGLERSDVHFRLEAGRRLVVMP
ncbi:iron dicitrate transport regulator FecR [Chitinophaga parva]|uniref:Iron dicitrate transport regulator FecR n=1 Tax=Chitinophaga parva TaxID=2169414 RepID=A0A2T7BJ85_9BACT|nr:FecR family protein [Chitinophaga parva]PUZ26350.1 iron dicitrate transport regulator FecR [Chitinophaga parva]